MYEMKDLIYNIRWIILIPIIAGIVRGLINILIRMARLPPERIITEKKIENNIKDLDIDEDLKKYFNYEE